MFKYINHPTLGYVLFKPRHQHAQIAKWLGESKVESAGVVCGHFETVATRGGSMTLGLPENKDDAEKIRYVLEEMVN